MAYIESATNTVAQTFIIDPSVVQYAEQVNITSIDLYFRKKPYGTGNYSGTLDPGVNVYLVPTSAGGAPNFGNTLDDFIVSRKEFSEIVSSKDATLATKFVFSPAVAVKTGIEYAVVFKPDQDEQFQLWASTKGEVTVTTNTNSPGIAGKFIGKYFELSKEKSTWQPIDYKSLKFHVNVGRYAFDGVIPIDKQPVFTLNIKNYEFVSHNPNNSKGTFMGGETIYQEKLDYNGFPLYDGTCSVIRDKNTVTTTGGGFAGFFSPTGDNSYIVIKHSGDVVNVRKVIAISGDNNSITLDANVSFTNAGAGWINSPVAKAYVWRQGKFLSNTDNFVVLSDSSANSTVRFSNNSVLKGEQSRATLANAYFEDILVHTSEPHIFVYTPPQATYKAKQGFTYTSEGGSTVISSGDITFDVNMYQATDLDVSQPVILTSRTNEVALRNWSSTQQSNSSYIRYQIITTNDYATPQIDYNATDVYFAKYIVNNDYTNEHTDSGNAISKHVTTKVTFADGRQAEDIRVYLQAYKPSGTDFKVYVKFYNSTDPEYFVDKNWTLLQETSSTGFSSSTNLSDYKEYTYSPYDYAEDLSYNIKYVLDGVVELGQPSPVYITANSVGIDNLSGTIYINNASDLFSPSQTVLYSVPDGNTAITGLTANTSYYVKSANSSGITLSESIGGSVVALSAATTNPAEVHSLLGDVSSDSPLVIGTDTDFTTKLIPGDLIKIYPELFPEKYIITAVSSIDSSVKLYVNEYLKSADIQDLGSVGLKVAKISLKNQAFVNKMNDNIIRYFNSKMAYFDKYDSFAIKIVFLSESDFIIPKLANIRAVGVSA